MLLAWLLGLSVIFSHLEHTESRALKGRPKNISYNIVNVTTIHLTWDPPRPNEIGNCPVNHYIIRYKVENDKQSNTWKLDGARHSASLNHMLEDTWYYIRVVAIGCNGKGRPSRWLKIKTDKQDALFGVQSDEAAETHPPGKPTYVRTRTYEESVMVEWRPPEEQILVRGYMVGYGEGVPDVNWQYVDSTARDVTVRNLKPGTQYVISLRAFNNFDKGPVVYDLVYTRDKGDDEEQTFASPTNVKAKILSPTTVWLQWTDPTLGRHQQITDNRYYNVHYQGSARDKSLSVIVKALHVVLYDLAPGTIYSFKVRTVMDSKSSDFSAIIQNKTLETAPTSAPRNIAITPNVTGVIRISWKPPRQPNGALTGYFVMYSTNPKQSAARWNTVAVQPRDLQTIIRGLQPNMTYYFKVQAKNSKGHGPVSQPVEHTTQPELVKFAPSPNPIPNIIVYQNTSQWTTYDGDNSDPKSRISDTATHDSTEQGSAAPVDPSDNAIDGLKQGSTEEGMLDLSVLVKDPLDVIFQSVVKHTVSAVVTWKLNCVDSHIPARYVIRYHLQSEPDLHTDAYSPTNFVLLDNLRPNSRYHFRVKRILEDGSESQWSAVGILNTHAPNT